MGRLQLVSAEKDYQNQWHYAVLDTSDKVIEFANQSVIQSLLRKGVKIDGISADGTPFQTYPVPCERILSSPSDRNYGVYNIECMAAEYQSTYKYEACYLRQGIKVQIFLDNPNRCALLVGSLRIHCINGYDDENKTANLKVTREGVLFPIIKADKWIMGFTDRVGSTAGGSALIEYICNLGDSPCTINWRSRY